MTRKLAAAGLASGGGKTAVAVPEDATLGAERRAGALRDVGDAVASLAGRYATGPDVGTTPRGHGHHRRAHRVSVLQAAGARR
jgi:glutamate dehydrogenase/leucine dehydrogenase